MPVTPTSIETLPAEGLRTHIANSATFRTKTGTASEAAAKARIYIERVDGTGRLGSTQQYVAPYALIATSEDEGHGYFGGMGNNGTLEVLFEGDSDAAHLTGEDRWYDFGNWVGAVRKEVLERASTQGLIIRRFSGVGVPSFEQEGNERRYLYRWYKVEWGLEF